MAESNSKRVERKAPDPQGADEQLGQEATARKAAESRRNRRDKRLHTRKRH